MDKELDYMSDEFIKNCTNTADDLRPGLLKSHQEQRQHEILKRKEQAVENQKKPNETEILEESLKQPINSSNKGFSMLQKMGFKSGMGLGKNSTGIVEPIEINFKNDKKGLGHKRKVKCVKNADSVSEDDFRAFLSKKNKKREVESDLRKSQRICKELDIKWDKSQPKESWFWPAEPADDQSDEGEDEDVELNDLEKLQMLTKYLRDCYFYCIWCKVQYNDEKDMEDCPGPTRDDH